MKPSPPHKGSNACSILNTSELLLNPPSEELTNAYLTSIAYEDFINETFEKELSRNLDPDIQRVLRRLNSLSKARMGVIISLMNLIGVKADFRFDDLVEPLLGRFMVDREKEPL